MAEPLVLAFIAGVGFGLFINNVIFPVIFGIWLRLIRADARGR